MNGIFGTEGVVAPLQGGIILGDLATPGVARGYYVVAPSGRRMFCCVRRLCFGTSY